jgi:phosphate:Na+ symporter
METFATIFAGLGLFFVGVKLIGGNLKQMSGRGFRRVVARGVEHPVPAAALGTLAGALTQSTNAVTFICINTVTAGLVKVRRVLPLLVWANVGTSALVLLATLNVHLLVMLLLGAVGVLYYLDLDKGQRTRHAVGALLGIGLLFLGLDEVRTGAAALQQDPVVQAFVAFSQSSYLIAFLIGLLLTVAAQSSATVSVVAVAMAEAGVLGLDQTIMIVYGAGVGSGMAVWLMAANLSGTPRQLADLQLLTKCAGAGVLVPLFLVEYGTGVPLVQALLAELAPGSTARQVAWTYLIYQLVSAGLVSLMLGPLFRGIRRVSPEAPAESLAQPRFVYDGGVSEAETGLVLAEREQQRLLGFLRDSLDGIRQDAAAGAEGLPDPQVLRRAGRSVGAEVSGFLAELAHGAPPPDTMERVTRLQTAQSILDDLTDKVGDLVAELDAAQVTPALAPTAHALVESLHLVILTLIDEMEDHDPLQLEALQTMTADRSDMMDRVRRDLVRGDQPMSKREQDTLFTVTALFEQNIWLVRRYLTLTRGRATVRPAPESPEAGSADAQPAG